MYGGSDDDGRRGGRKKSRLYQSDLVNPACDNKFRQGIELVRQVWRAQDNYIALNAADRMARREEFANLFGSMFVFRFGVTTH